MKKLLIVILTIGLFAACNNDKGNDRLNPGREKDDYRKDDGTKDKKDDYTKDEGDKKNADDTKETNWSRSDENKFLSDCKDELQDNRNSKQICSCVLEKIENKYASLDEADRLGGKAAGEKFARQCVADLDNTGRDDNNNSSNNNNNNKNYQGGNDDSNDDNSRSGSGWTNQQRQQFIQGCSSSAQKAQGLTERQANDYCDCMTRKVEAKYSFKEASQLTASDLQTAEWRKAISACLEN